LEKCNLRNWRSPVTLTLTLDRVIRHTVVHHSSTSIYMYIPNFNEIGKSLWTGVPTDGHFPSFNVIRSTRRSGPKNGTQRQKFHSHSGKLQFISHCYLLSSFTKTFSFTSMHHTRKLLIFITSRMHINIIAIKCMILLYSYDKASYTYNKLWISQLQEISLQLQQITDVYITGCSNSKTSKNC